MTSLLQSLSTVILEPEKIYPVTASTFYPSICHEVKEIQPVHSEGDQLWDFFERNDAKVETPVLWPPHARVDSLEKTLMLGGIGGRRRRG